jgi:hypothetical protein
MGNLKHGLPDYLGSTQRMPLPGLTAGVVLLPLPREQQASEQRSQQPVFLLLV